MLVKKIVSVIVGCLILAVSSALAQSENIARVLPEETERNSQLRAAVDAEIDAMAAIVARAAGDTIRWDSISDSFRTSSRRIPRIAPEAPEIPTTSFSFLSIILYLPVSHILF